MLFNEPKLLKCWCVRSGPAGTTSRFSALQRAEIAEIELADEAERRLRGFSALQRAEIAEIITEEFLDLVERNVSVLFNEPKLLKCCSPRTFARPAAAGFSALQRAEIAEIAYAPLDYLLLDDVSVLFNEPKLLKS